HLVLSTPLSFQDLVVIVMGNSIGDSKIEDKPSPGAKVQSLLKQEVLFHYYE
ncbi:hypothetical protein BHE74_00008043, partial [Ensete ventricosum]